MLPAHDRQTLSMLLRNRREKRRWGRMSEICTAVKRSLNSSEKQAFIANCFSK
jgi:hypothetical protein